MIVLTVDANHTNKLKVYIDFFECLIFLVSPAFWTCQALISWFVDFTQATQTKGMATSQQSRSQIDIIQLEELGAERAIQHDSAIG